MSSQMRIAACVASIGSISLAYFVKQSLKLFLRIAKLVACGCHTRVLFRISADLLVNQKTDGD
jgi:hypothetical protein